MERRPSPFANIPQGKENDFLFLLERFYSALAADAEARHDALKGKLGEHEAKIKKLEADVCSLETCPCDKRLDHGKQCPLWILEKEVLRNKWRNIGIYSGFFTSGALCYYIIQLLLAYWRIR